MLIIYGSLLCPDCVACLEKLEREGKLYEFRDFGTELKNLKEFLAIRDTMALFDQAKAYGKIGIPCICREDGEVTLDWESL